MDWIRHDLRFALRGLRRRPGVSLLAILTLAVGLGVNTVAFSAVNALVFRPFHVPGADQIAGQRPANQTQADEADLHAWRRRGPVRRLRPAG